MLQIYVILANPTKQAGIGALISIVVSAFTTAFTGAKISIDLDIDAGKRKHNPQFYGYIPDDHSLRNRCFCLMLLISALHNLSRSVGCALLVASSGKTTFAYFFGGEMIIFLAWKIVRRDFHYW